MISSGHLQKSAQRGAANIESYEGSLIERLVWDDLKFFLVCFDTGSFSGASRVLKTAPSTISRRIDRLEGHLGLALFHRTVEGVVPTEVGEILAEKARLMHQSLCSLEQRHRVLVETDRFDIRIAVTEGLGSYWLMPRLVEFQRNQPNVIINLFCAMESVDVLRLEADMAIQFVKPTNPDLIVVKLGKLHLYTFASEDYLATFGVPRDIKDVLNHKVVEQVAPNLDMSAMPSFLKLPSLRNLASVRTNNSTAHLYAIEKGAGLGVLPSFASALGAKVVPVDIAPEYALDLYLTYHPGIRDSAQKMRVVSWVKEIFDPAIYPWFRTAFIHPRELAQMVPPSANANFGDGYYAVDPTTSLLRKAW